MNSFEDIGEEILREMNLSGDSGHERSAIVNKMYNKFQLMLLDEEILSCPLIAVPIRRQYIKFKGERKEGKITNDEYKQVLSFYLHYRRYTLEYAIVTQFVSLGAKTLADNMVQYGVNKHVVTATRFLSSFTANYHKKHSYNFLVLRKTISCKSSKTDFKRNQSFILEMIVEFINDLTLEFFTIIMNNTLMTREEIDETQNLMKQNEVLDDNSDDELIFHTSKEYDTHNRDKLSIIAEIESEDDVHLSVSTKSHHYDDDHDKVCLSVSTKSHHEDHDDEDHDDEDHDDEDHDDEDHDDEDKTFSSSTSAAASEESEEIDANNYFTMRPPPPPPGDNNAVYNENSTQFTLQSTTL